MAQFPGLMFKLPSGFGLRSFLPILPSLAESRGKAQAACLRKMQVETQAKVLHHGKLRPVAASELHKGAILSVNLGILFLPMGR